MKKKEKKSKFVQKLKVESLDPHVLKVDNSYQRPVHEDFIKSNLLKNFDESVFGHILVAKRKDGTYWIVDGQQRTRAAIMLKKDKVPCEVFNSDGPVHESFMFDVKNSVKKSITPYELWKARLASNNPDARKIDYLVTKHQLIITNKSNTGKQIACIGAIQKALKDLGFELLDDMLYILTNAFPSKNKKRVSENTVKGFAEFLKNNKEAIYLIPDFKNKFIRKLKTETIDSIYNKVKEKFLFIRKNSGYNVYHLTAAVLKEIYNNKIKDSKNRLP